MKKKLNLEIFKISGIFEFSNFPKSRIFEISQIFFLQNLKKISKNRISKNKILFFLNNHINSLSSPIFNPQLPNITRLARVTCRNPSILVDFWRKSPFIDEAFICSLIYRRASFNLPSRPRVFNLPSRRVSIYRRDGRLRLVETID